MRPRLLTGRRLRGVAAAAVVAVAVAVAVAAAAARRQPRMARSTD
jgi:hypothetical protein